MGANYEEAQSSTYKEFSQKIRISLREAKQMINDKWKMIKDKKVDSWKVGAASCGEFPEVKIS